jgi:altronate dehydratase small subunit
MSSVIAPKVWIIAPTDNVGTVVGMEAPARTTLPIIGAVNGSIEAGVAIPHGHKIALKAMPMGSDVVKYGVVIGRAVRPIERGEHVHVHNIESLRGRGDL